MEIFLALVLFFGAFSLGSAWSEHHASTARIAESEPAAEVRIERRAYTPCRYSKRSMVQRDLTVPFPRKLTRGNTDHNEVTRGEAE